MTTAWPFVASPGLPCASRPGGPGRLLTSHSIRKQCVDVPPRSWELIALSLLAGIGFGLALYRGDAIFVAVFGAACAMAIIGGMQRDHALGRKPWGQLGITYQTNYAVVVRFR